jgi:hypothetical protein
MSAVVFLSSVAISITAVVPAYRLGRVRERALHYGGHAVGISVDEIAARLPISDLSDRFEKPTMPAIPGLPVRTWPVGTGWIKESHRHRWEGRDG